MEYLVGKEIAIALYIIREIAQFFLTWFGFYTMIMVPQKLLSKDCDFSFIEAVRFCIEENIGIIYHISNIIIRRNIFKHDIKVVYPNDGGLALYSWLRNSFPMSRYKFGDYDASELTNAIASLDTNNPISPNDFNTYITIKFVRKQDAALFKLTWG